MAENEEQQRQRELEELKGKLDWYRASDRDCKQTATGGYLHKNHLRWGLSGFLCCCMLNSLGIYKQY